MAATDVGSNPSRPVVTSLDITMIIVKSCLKIKVGDRSKKYFLKKKIPHVGVHTVDSHYLEVKGTL